MICVVIHKTLPTEKLQMSCSKHKKIIYIMYNINAVMRESQLIRNPKDAWFVEL
jgi:hypothetical protein